MTIYNTIMALLERCGGGGEMKDEMAARGIVKTQSGDEIRFTGSVKWMEPDVVLFVEGEEAKK